MTLEERVKQCTRQELLDLFDEAEELHRTGILPMRSSLRAISNEVLDSSMVFYMTMVSYAIYRELATMSVQELGR